MAKTIAYMITWTTYGTWLQGDERGFVENGIIYYSNQSLADSNRQNLTKEPVKLSAAHRKIVQNAILEKAKQLNQKIYAVSVSSNHVHILAQYISAPIGLVVRYYKNYAQAALRKTGIVGRIWTKGFDKRYCFDEKSLNSRVGYINLHNKSPKGI